MWLNALPMEPPQSAVEQVKKGYITMNQRSGEIRPHGIEIQPYESNKGKEIKSKYNDMEELQQATNQLEERKDRVAIVYQHAEYLFQEFKSIAEIAKVLNGYRCYDSKKLDKAFQEKKAIINSAYKNSMPGKGSFFACFSCDSIEKRGKSETKLNDKTKELENWLVGIRTDLKGIKNELKEKLEQDKIKLKSSMPIFSIERLKKSKSLKNTKTEEAENAKTENAIDAIDGLLASLNGDKKLVATNYKEYNKKYEAVTQEISENFNLMKKMLEADIEKFKQYQSKIFEDSPFQRALSGAIEVAGKILKFVEKESAMPREVADFCNNEYDGFCKDIEEKIEKQGLEDLRANIRYIASFDSKNPSIKESSTGKDKYLDGVETSLFGIESNSEGFEADKGKYIKLLKEIIAYKGIKEYTKEERINRIQQAENCPKEELSPDQWKRHSKMRLDLSGQVYVRHDKMLDNIRAESSYLQYGKKIKDFVNMRKTLKEHIEKFKVWERNITKNINLQKEISKVRGNAEILLEDSYKEGILGNFTNDYNQCTKIFKEVENKANQELDKIWLE